VNVDDIRIVFDESSLTTLKIVIGLILFGIALDTDVEDFRRAARRPGTIAIGVAAQFLLLPAITFLLTLALGVRGSVALGMILVACCPPGNVSNILTHRAGACTRPAASCWSGSSSAPSTCWSRSGWSSGCRSSSA
jgi:BASS family bile acid:Na+ symporter